MTETRIIYGCERYELLISDFEMYKARLNNLKCRKASRLRIAAAHCLYSISELKTIVEDDYHSRAAATKRWLTLYYEILKELERRS